MNKFCFNHPNKRALSFCHNCGQYYCENCLIEGKEYYYCKSPDCLKLLGNDGLELKKQRKKTPKILINFFLLLLAVVIGGTIGHITGRTLGTDLFKTISRGISWVINIPEQRLSIDNNAWKTTKFLDTNLSLTAPFEFSFSSMDIPLEIMSQIEESHHFRFHSNPVLVDVTYIYYSNEQKVNLDGAAEEAIKGIQNGSGVLYFMSSISQIKKGNIEGRLLTGTFELEDQDFQYKGLVLAKNSKMWSVISVYLSNSHNQAIIDKVINSIHIDG